MLGRQQEPPAPARPEDHPGALDVGDLERDDLGRPQSRSQGDAQRRLVTLLPDAAPGASTYSASFQAATHAPTLPWQGDHPVRTSG